MLQKQEREQSDSFLSTFRSGKTQLEESLTLASLLIFPFSVGSFIYWIFERTYTKWTLLPFMSMLLFIGTFGLRTSLIEQNKEVNELTREEAQGMGLSLTEAKEYEKKKLQVSIFHQWVILVSFTCLLATVFLIWWPV